MGFIGKQPSKAAITSSDITDGVVTTDKIAADAITDAKIADDVVGTEHLTAGEVDTTALGADAVTGAKIADDAINSEHYTDGSIDTAHIADANVTQAKIADQSINEAKMQISNAPTNGYFLSAQSGNTGGLTWAEAGGAVELVYSGNLSSSVFNIDNVFSTSHRVYKMFIDGAYPSSDGEMQFNFRSGGSSGSIENDSDYRFTGVRQERQSSGSAAVTQAGDGWGSSYGRIGQSLESSNAEYTINVEFTVWNPIDTKPTYYASISSQMDASGSWVVGYHNNGIYWNNASITGIAINAAAGSWSGGKVRIYGFKES
jgi:hypothetical protein